MTLRRLLLWRHGETHYNASMRMQGQLDSALTDRGREQAAASARALAVFSPELLRTSDQRRATETAVAFSELTGLPADVDKRLRETYLGQWQGLAHEEVERGWPGAMAQWRADATWAPPGGEARIEVANRAARVVAELDQGSAAVALLCAHGGLIAGLTPLLLGLPVPNWPVFAGIGNGHWAVLTRRVGTGWRLSAYNAAVCG